MDIYVQKNGQPQGPFSETRISDGINDGEFAPGDLACASKEGPWQPLSVLIHLGMTTPLLISNESAHGGIQQPVRSDIQTLESGRASRLAAGIFLVLASSAAASFNGALTFWGHLEPSAIFKNLVICLAVIGAGAYAGGAFIHPSVSEKGKHPWNPFLKPRREEQMPLVIQLCAVSVFLCFLLTSHWKHWLGWRGNDPLTYRDASPQPMLGRYQEAPGTFSVERHRHLFDPKPSPSWQSPMFNHDEEPYDRSHASTPPSNSP